MRGNNNLVRAVVTALMTIGAAVGVAATTGSTPASATSPTTKFTTPGCWNYPVPPKVAQVEINAFGAQGGSGLTGNLGVLGTGGLGGAVSGLLNVGPGESLDVCVGGSGDDPAVGGIGPGMNGGGAPGSGGVNIAATGGGASDVRIGVQLTDRVLVAGGGGGSAALPFDPNQAALPGGAGGGTSGTDCAGTYTGCGAGGTQLAGGAAGCGGALGGNCGTAVYCWFPQSAGLGTAGDLGVGGSGGWQHLQRGPSCLGGNLFDTYAGGGGGGGYYGGGGGLYGSGGGGSSFVAPSIQATGAWTNTAGVHTGDGEVDITPTITGFAVGTTSLPPATRGAVYGPVTLNAVNVDPSASPFVTTLKWKKVTVPKGLKLSSTGVLSGTPKTKLVPGQSSVTLTLTEKVTTFNGTTKVKTTTTVQATIPLTIG
jgi:hypothetical protein